jgi:hypothetical protein
MGIKECPICQARVTTWHKTQTKSKINPLVLSLGGAFDASADPLIPKPKKEKKAQNEKVAEGVVVACVPDVDISEGKTEKVPKNVAMATTADVESSDDEGKPKRLVSVSTVLEVAPSATMTFASLTGAAHVGRGPGARRKKTSSMNTSFVSDNVVNVPPRGVRKRSVASWLDL